MRPSRAWAAIAFAPLLAVGAAKLRAHSVVNAAGSHIYDYSKHGQEWAAGTCSSRSRQSPIDIPAASFHNPLPSGKFIFSYETITYPFFIINNGHTLSADISGLGYGGVSYADAWFDVMFINVHALSEHTFDGVHKPAELHLVHKRYDSDALLIIAIPLDSTNPPPAGGNALPSGSAYVAPPRADPNFSPMVQAFLKVAPPAPMWKQKVPGDVVTPPDLAELLSGAHFYEYAGSTTAPPCAENVVWLVRSQPVMASDTQLRYLHDALFSATHGYGNYRMTMPLQGRAINLLVSVREEVPRVEVDTKPFAKSPHVDPEMRSMEWARDALKAATASLDYVRSIDQRLHAAADLSAHTLEPLTHAAIESMGAPAPSPAPAPAPALTDAEKAAMAMASTIATAAREAVANATAEIGQQARAAALQAAREAATQVLENMQLQGKSVLAPEVPDPEPEELLPPPQG